MVTLQSPNRVAMPGWLTDQSASQSLKDYQAQIPGLFDTSGLQKAAMDYNQSFANRAEMGFDAQANAAQNRAMLNGGRVGSSFAKGGLMLGLQGNLNDMQYKYAQLAASMKAQQAGALGSVAGQLADYGQRRQGMLSDFTQGQQRLNLGAQTANQQAALDAQRMAMQKSQFDKTYDLQNRQFGLDQQNAAARNAALALQYMPNQRIGYSTYADGVPRTSFDQDQMLRQNQQNQMRQNLLGQLTGGRMF